MINLLAPPAKVIKVLALNRVSLEFSRPAGPLAGDRSPNVSMGRGDSVELDIIDLWQLKTSLQYLETAGQIRITQIGYPISASTVGVASGNSTIDLQTFLDGIAGGSIPAVFGTELEPVPCDGVVIPVTLVARNAVIFVEGTSGPVTYTGLPLTGLYIGQTIDFVGEDDADTVTFENGPSLSVDGPVTLAKDEVWTTFWTGSKWVDRSRQA